GLIDGWYGGPAHPSGRFDGTFVPPASTTDDDSADLYRGVFARSCRTCHAQREGYRNFSTYDKFWQKMALVQQRVFDEGAMPLSQKGAMNFWLSYPSQPAILAHWLGIALHGPGVPVARIRLATPGVIRPGTQVVLDGGDSQYSQSFTWTQTSGPAV